MKKEEKILKDFAKFLDDITPWDEWLKGLKGKAAEAVDRLVYSMAIRAGYNALPDNHKEKALALMESLASGNYDALGNGYVDVLVSKIETRLGDDLERIVIGGQWRMIKELIRYKRGISTPLPSTATGGQTEPGQGPTEPDPD